MEHLPQILEATALKCLIDWLHCPKKEKSNIVANLGTHRLRAKTFHKLMRENPLNSTTLCFDMQQIQALPKLSINEAYYSRQINYHTLCITDTENKKPHFCV